jgi:hypothetical protein
MKEEAEKSNSKAVRVAEQLDAAQAEIAGEYGKRR